MLLSDDDLSARLSSPDNLINKCQSKPNTSHSSNLQVKVITDDRGKRGSEIPDVVRELIAITSASSREKESKIAETFDVSQPFVSQVKRGMIDSHQDERLTEITRSKAEELEKSAHEAALDNLVSALSLVAPKLIEESSPRALARIAVDMSTVVKSLRKDDSASAAASKVVINMVSMKKEDHFDTIDV